LCSVKEKKVVDKNEENQKKNQQWNINLPTTCFKI
jgi:hypothetical protein